MPPTVVNYRW